GAPAEQVDLAQSAGAPCRTVIASATRMSPRHRHGPFLKRACNSDNFGEARQCSRGHKDRECNDYLMKSLDRKTTGRSAWTCSSKNLRDARSSITSRSRTN